MRISIRSAVTVFAIALAASFGAGATAQAAENQCISGYTCGWAYANYSYNNLITEYDDAYFGAGLDNTLDSVSNWGNLDCATFFARANYSGEWIQFSRPALGGTWKDPYLTNGGGQAGYTLENWANRASSLDLWRC